MPFDSFVVGTGVVEAGTGNVVIGTPVAGIVSRVRVGWGEQVKAGDPLFEIDDRELRAQMPSAAARVQEAAATLARSQYQLQLASKLETQSALSAEQLHDRKFQADIDAAALAAARAEVARLQAELERHIVRAPVAGRVLQINTRPGEFAPSGVTTVPLMVVGDDTRLRVRVDIDENDALRVVPGAAAIGVVRSEPRVSARLRFESIEPYVVPRKTLTGDVAERTDARVLQVLYGVTHADLPVFVGQRLDVYIESTPDTAKPAVGALPSANAAASR